MHESFLSYRGARWLWISVGLVLVICAIYWWHTGQIPYPPSGGSWYGYTLGTIGALLILWLLYFGRRKRNYMSNFGGTVQAWLSAHVYLGTALLVVATLHTGVQFGLNVHTLAYVLMCIVIFSGFFGVYVYARYPDLVTANNQGKTFDQMLDDVGEFDTRILRAAAQLHPALQKTIASALDRTEVGGDALTQLRAGDRSMMVLADGSLVANGDQQPLLDLLVDRLTQSSNPQETGLLHEVIDQVGLRNEALRRIRRDIQLHGILRIWLFVHVPLSFATVAALIVHVISVFLYW